MHQPLWRDATTIQFGVDRRAEVAVTERWHEQLLEQLWRGIRSNAFDVVVHTLGAPADEAQAFLEALRPALRLPESDERPVTVRAVHPSDAGAEFWARDALRDLGLRVTDAEHARSVTVGLVRGSCVAQTFANDLSSDRAHLPIAFDRGGVTIGPLVIPGLTPCLTCRDVNETARDPAWPLVHAQLAGAAAGAVSAVRVVAATTMAARLMRQSPPGGVSVRLSADGRMRRSRFGFAASCACRESVLTSPRETETVAAAYSRAPAPTRSTACAQPA